MNSTGRRPVSDSRLWNKCMDKSQPGNLRNGAKKKAHRKRSCVKIPRDIDVAIGPNEIEIDLNMQDSQVIFKHLAALCGDIKSKSRGYQNSQDRHIGDHPNVGDICDVQSETPNSSSDEKRRRHTNRSPMRHSCASSNFSLQSVTKKESYKDRSKKLKLEMKTLRNNCEKKGMKIVKEFQLKEKLRRQEDELKYKVLKKNFKREIDERKRIAREKLKRQREKIKLKNKEENRKLRVLREKIKKKCKGLKYYVDDECLDYYGA